MATRNAKRFTTLCLSALLTAGFIPTAALANNVTPTDQQATVDAVAETADTETTEADVTPDTALDEVVEPVEPAAPTENEVDPTQEYTEPDLSLETDSGEIPTPADERFSSELGIEYPPPQKILLITKLFL